MQVKSSELETGVVMGSRRGVGWGGAEVETGEF